MYVFNTLCMEPRPVANYVTSAVESVLALHREGKSGDILVFLTGQEEVETTVAQLRWAWLKSGHYGNNPVSDPLLSAWSFSLVVCRTPSVQGACQQL